MERRPGSEPDIIASTLRPLGKDYIQIQPKMAIKPFSDPSVVVVIRFPILGNGLGLGAKQQHQHSLAVGLR